MGSAISSQVQTTQATTLQQSTSPTTTQQPQTATQQTTPPTTPKTVITTSNTESGTGGSTSSGGSSSSSSGASTSTTSGGSTSTTSGGTSGVNLVFSNRKGGQDVVIKEKGTAFTDVNIPRGTAVMRLDLQIPDTIKSLALTAQADNKDLFLLNGKETLDVDVKVPPSVIVVHEKGENSMRDSVERMYSCLFVVIVVVVSSNSRYAQMFFKNTPIQTAQSKIIVCAQLIRK